MHAAIPLRCIEQYKNALKESRLKTGEITLFAIGN